MSHWAYNRLVTSTVLVNLKPGDRAFRGVIWSRRGPLLELRQAVLLEQGTETPVDGTVVIDVVNVEFIQVLS